MFTYKDAKPEKLSFHSFEEKLKKEHQYLLKYFELNSARIEQTTNELKESLIKEIEGNPDEETKVNYFYEAQLSSIVSFYYHSSITLVHSFFENQLFQLCKLIQSKTKSKFDITLLNGRDHIKSGLNYLTLTTNLSENVLNKHKPRLGKFQRIRNKIIHQNSTYKDETDRLKLYNDFGKQIDFYGIENKFFISSDVLPKEYLERTMGLYEEILNHLRSVDFIIPLELNERNTEDLPF